jgi:hypothetical protein
MKPSSRAEHCVDAFFVVWVACSFAAFCFDRAEENRDAHAWLDKPTTPAQRASQEPHRAQVPPAHRQEQEARTQQALGSLTWEVTLMNEFYEAADHPTEIALAMLLGWEHIPWGINPDGAWIRDDPTGITYSGRKVAIEFRARRAIMYSTSIP